MFALQALAGQGRWLMKPAWLLLFSLAICLLFPNAAHAGLVSNGGFETGDLSSWTEYGSPGMTGVDSNAAHSGVYGAYFGPVHEYDFISQTLTTEAGTIYELTFWERFDVGVPAQVWWDGNLVYNLAGAPGEVWTMITVSDLVATGESTVLALGFWNPPAYTEVDDIDVVATGSSVPEPSTFILGVAGLAGLVLRRRRAG
jgi:hypothetical protein